jgi:1,4-alpha-glucan branching enzyme
MFKLDMGAQPATNGCLFRVWAPFAKEVYVIGTFNDFSHTANPLSREEGNGNWSGFIEGAKPGHEYKYRIVSDTGEHFRVDPYSRLVTNSAGNSIIHNPVFDWGEKPFDAPNFNEMVIYEMHIGTFAAQRGNKPGTIDDAIDRLPYLQKLGVNAIEIMPIAEFPGGWSWGYNPSLIFAIESDYGSPADFRHFVRAAHRHGIAVIMDVVYNHLGPSDLDLWKFDGWSENDKGGIYFYNDWRSMTPWGDSRPDYGRGEVRKYLRDNALFWLLEYKLDGLRWDATAYMRNVNGSNNDWGGDIPEAWSLMQWINDEVHEHKAEAITIAEDMKHNPWIIKDTGAGGAGFDAQWDGMFVHHVRQALLVAEDQARDMEAVCNAILNRFDLDAFERVIYTESHDEVANGRARVPEEVAPGNASNWFAKKKSTLGAALVLTAPGIPMIFQGQEFLEDRWFHDRDPLEWSRKRRFKGILQFYRDLIALRRNLRGVTAGLMAQNVQVHHVNHNDKVIAFHRWDQGGPGDHTMVVVNFRDQAWEEYDIGFPHDGTWKVRLNGDSKSYDPEFGDFLCPDVTVEPGEYDGQPYRGRLRLAPYGVLILSAGEKPKRKQKTNGSAK